MRSRMFIKTYMDSILNRIIWVTNHAPCLNTISSHVIII